MKTNYEDIIGRKVSVVVDRPLGTAHPKYKNLIYGLNYGYIKGIEANDGETKIVTF